MLLGAQVLAAAVCIFSIAFAFYVSTAGYASKDPTTGAVRSTGFAPQLFFSSSLVGIWPVAVLVWMRYRKRLATVAAGVAYVLFAVLFGFSVGGPHLTYGVVPLMAALVLFVLSGAGRTPSAPAKRPRGWFG